MKVDFNNLRRKAVRTFCDHRDSVLTTAYGTEALDLKPCEVWHQDHAPIRP